MLLSLNLCKEGGDFTYPFELRKFCIKILFFFFLILGRYMGANEAGSAHCRNCVSMEILGGGEADELQDYY